MVRLALLALLIAMAGVSGCTRRMSTELGVIEIICIGICVSHALHAQRRPWEPRVIEEAPP